MQNKPNLLDAQMNVSSILTKDYENEIAFGLRENKPNLCHRYQTQFPSAPSQTKLVKRPRAESFVRHHAESWKFAFRNSY